MSSDYEDTRSAFLEARLKRNARIIELWKEGTLSASQIAQRMGEGVTRNTVIGVAKRANLPRKPPSGARRSTKTRETIVRTPAGTPNRVYTPAKRLAPDGYVPRGIVRTPGEGVLLEDLGVTHCRNPFEEIEPRVFRYCGRDNGFKTYCPECRALMYEPPRVRNRTKPAYDHKRKIFV